MKTIKTISLSLMAVTALFTGCLRKPDNPEPIETKFKVTFHTFNGSNVPTQEVVSGKTATKPEEPTKSGYTFTGNWYIGDAPSLSKPETAKEFDFTSTVITGDITLYAGFLISELPVIIDNNGAGGGTAATFPTDQKLKIISSRTDLYSYDIETALKGAIGVYLKDMQQGMATKAGKSFKGLSLIKNASSDADLLISSSGDLKPTNEAAIATISVKGSPLPVLSEGEPELKLYAAYY